jgi:hypothetical protein
LIGFIALIGWASAFASWRCKRLIALYLRSIGHFAGSGAFMVGSFGLGWIGRFRVVRFDCFVGSFAW